LSLPIRVILKSYEPFRGGQNKKAPTHFCVSALFSVGPPGLEPGTT
jgi:hypothetical protein